MKINSNIINQINIFVIALIISVASTYLIKPSAPKIATLDIDSIIKEFVLQNAKSNRSKEELEKAVSQLDHELQNLMEKIKNEKNIVIIPSKSVIYGKTYGNNDITEQVKEIILGKNL